MCDAYEKGQRIGLPVLFCLPLGHTVDRYASNLFKLSVRTLISWGNFAQKNSSTGSTTKLCPMLLDKIDATQVHRETYIAVINGMLRKRGDKQTLADKAGMKAEHLSNMLNPGLTADSYIRTPGPKLAERIVALLPVDLEVRQSLREHLYFAWAGERETLTSYSRQRMLSYYAIRDIVGDLGRAHVEATHTADPRLAKHNYRVISHACKLILERIDPDPERVGSADPDFDANPLEFVQVCLFLHDVQCVLNRADDALFHAKVAAQIMEACDRDKFSTRIDYFDHLKVNTLVAESLAYRNLKLLKQADEASRKAEELIQELGSTSAEFWLPHVYMHRLKAVIQRSRFTLGDVDGLLMQIDKAYGRRPYDFQPRWQEQLAEARARGYLQYGIRCGTGHSIKTAARILQKTAESIERNETPQLGAVLRSRIARTYAETLWHQKEFEGWKLYIQLSLSIALNAGLDHQLAEANQEYGSAILPIIIELEGTSKSKALNK